MDQCVIAKQVGDIARDFGEQRAERQRRRALDRADFGRLAEAGFLLTGVSVEHDGIWAGSKRSTRPISDMVRTLARADSSVALVASMHPAVLSSTGVIGLPEAPPPFRDSWEHQRGWIAQTVRDGHWWGTLISEPGSGGDSNRVKAVAHPSSDATGYRLTGVKHFGSGSGVMSFMITTAVVAGESEPDHFFLDLREAPWDGSTGVKLLAEWDGHGMIATQSHAFEFTDFPATRFAWPQTSRQQLGPAGGWSQCFWAGVVLGIVETGLATARRQLAGRRGLMTAYEQVEWTRAELEGWLIEQAYEGMLRAIEHKDAVAARRDAVRGKVAIADLSERVMQRICRLIGGGTYSQHSPFGFWLEDVRALGFLRPPWGRAYESLSDLGGESSG